MRTSVITIVCLLVGSSGLCQGGPNDSLYQKAQDFELEHEYGQACQIYDTLVQRGYRVDEIQAKRSYRMHRELEARYLKEVATGDKAFAASQYIEAREAYYRATAIHPDDTYPKEQIKRIEEIIARQKQ